LKRETSAPEEKIRLLSSRIEEAQSLRCVESLRAGCRCFATGDPHIENHRFETHVDETLLEPLGGLNPEVGKK
jgi:hypothetical protein